MAGKPRAVWPYGRVVAGSENGVWIGDGPAIKRNRKKADNILSDKMPEPGGVTGYPQKSAYSTFRFRPPRDTPRLSATLKLPLGALVRLRQKEISGGAVLGIAAMQLAARAAH